MIWRVVVAIAVIMLGLARFEFNTERNATTEAPTRGRKKVSFQQKKDEYGNTALHTAAALGDEKHVIYLLKHGLDPNEHNIHDETPLHCALRLIAHINPTVVSLLIQHDANVFEKIKKRKFLHPDNYPEEGLRPLEFIKFRYNQYQVLYTRHCARLLRKYNIQLCDKYSDTQEAKKIMRIVQLLVAGERAQSNVKQFPVHRQPIDDTDGNSFVSR